MNECISRHFGFDEPKRAVQETIKCSNEVVGVVQFIELKDSVSSNETDNDPVLSLELNMQALSLNEPNVFSTVSNDLLLYRPRKHGKELKELAQWMSKMSLMSKPKQKNTKKNKSALNKKKNNRRFNPRHDRIT